MKIIKISNNSEAGKVVSDLILEEVKSNSNIVLGLATGSSPITTYENIIVKSKEQNIDWSKVTTFNLDEYKGLAPDHSQSYRYFMNNKLFNHINIDSKNTFVPSGMIETNQEAQKYDELIAQKGGIDLQLLGLGINGHVGFNEPGSEFEGLTSVVKLTKSTIEANARFFDNEKDVPTQAISMGLKSIMNAKKIILIATGEAKAEAVKNLVEGPVSKNWPCSILLNHKDVTVVIDHEAAKLLK
ncbi:glucosamine-6-phosphate deaminase [Spiroplasma cantharicola]|uniref:Glucosamine-6-phosphate deaminase n=1 Tax=Spiroplasma cantharicola TaxID=362837 RepID=A0A0M4K0Q5_9MOLU|nr:glucosamine-6-phosphate deaminase [Spiroplasma cantharicola]ALD66062.1 glucosamine-6-phosphate deaminase [Spiroplasma cantharicola]